MMPAPARAAPVDRHPADICCRGVSAALAPCSVPGEGAYHARARPRRSMRKCLR